MFWGFWGFWVFCVFWWFSGTLGGFCDSAILGFSWLLVSLVFDLWVSGLFVCFVIFVSCVGGFVLFWFVVSFWFRIAW